MENASGDETAPIIPGPVTLGPSAPPTIDQRRTGTLLCLALALVTFIVYLRATHCGFVNLDDRQYVVDNELVKRGLTLRGIEWAFTTNELANWHPLTWLSYMVDCQWFGVNPRAMHLENIVLHIINTLLLFRLLERLTGATWRSALVAALFALHPLHVESVAWISERKDVLSTLFWLLSTGAYLRYVVNQSPARMVAVAGWLALGLMTKPMLVTLPCTLLLLDYWPLGQFSPADGVARNFWRRLSVLAREKWLLFVVVLASSLVTFLAQRAGGAVQDLEVLPWSQRLANVPVSYVRYLGQTFWPVQLAAFYPLPQMSEHAAIASGSFFAWALAATALLAAISLFAFLLRKQCPYLLVGWLWYLGTLVPVIGLVQVGEQAMADRYTYVPLIGVFLMIVWGLSDLAMRFHVRQTWLATASALLLLACAVGSWRQIGYWHDTQTLFERAIEVTPRNPRAHNTLGAYQESLGQPSEAKRHFRAALEISPTFFPALNNLGRLLAAEHQDAEAARYYREAMRVRPDSVIAHMNLGNLYARDGRLEEAVAPYVEVLRIVTAHRHLDYKLGLQARDRLAMLLPSGGTVDEALKRFTSVSQKLSAEQLARIRAFYTDVLAREPRFDAARQAMARFNLEGR